MTRLYGKDYTAGQLKSYVGRMEQVAGIQRFVYDDGKARGVRAARLYTGSGLDFTVALDRGMDIPLASFNGAPLNWLSQVGVAAPEFYEPLGKGWDYTFFGGLVQTCGLRSAGHDSTVGREQFGLHGRISTTPAEKVNVTTDWRGDEYVLEIAGTMVEAHAYRENVVLKRAISTKAGAKGFSLRDEITNEGQSSTPHTVMYHVNPGFPVLSEHSEVLWSLEKVEGTTEAEFVKFTAPGSEREGGGYFYHKPDAEGRARVAVVNPTVGEGFGFAIDYDNAALPVMITWKVMKRHAYVIAIEPANCRIATNAKLAEQGILPMLEPGETRVYDINFGVLSTAAEIEAFKAALP